MSTKTIEWISDPKAEAVLADLNIHFTKGRLTLSEVDWSATKQNAGRTGRAIDKERVDEYALSMLEGDSFPMPIAVRSPESVEILAGVHRTLAAKEAELQTISVYFATITLPHQARLIAIMTNCREGVRESKEQRLEQGVHLVKEFELKSTDVAALLRLPIETLRTRLRSEEVQQEAVEAGFKGKLPISVFGKLVRIAGNAKVLASTCDCLSRIKNPTDESTNLVREVLKHKTEAQQLSCIEKCIEKDRIRQNVETESPIKLSMRAKFVRSLHSLETAVGDRTREGLQIVKDSDDHNTLRREWRILRGKINRVLE